MAITDDEKYLLNNKFGPLAAQVQLGTLIENAETGGLANGAVDTDQLAADAVTAAKIEDDAVSIEHLDTGILPAFVVKFAGEHTTVGGDASEAITVAGALATDLVVVALHTKGASPVTVLTASADADVVNVELSADPSTDHVLTYIVYRAAA